MAFGQSIGRIAHSHHWDIERVATELRGRTGSAAILPNTWTVDEIKVACLLRCADAAHIDHRRAPSMLYALTNPRGISQDHWNFQTKLNKPTRSNEVIIYSGASDFHLLEASSWWLCFDALKLIDKELSSSHAVLQDLGEQPFAARRVFGAESPRILSRQIRCAGWFPVDAEIRVSDPVKLAQTLGGKNLYGRGPMAPIREILQNAADAVRARRRLENRDSLWGHIRLSIEQKGDEVWLHIDDNGIGMSERILVGPLLDFGKSLWNTAALREEFPGLEAKGIEPIGKFGIGFFSIFTLGQHVKVISKRYDAGSSDIRVLEFLSLTSRPIIRPAQPGDLPTDYSTRVSVRVDDVGNLIPEDDERFYSFRHRLVARRSLLQEIKVLIASLDVHADISDLRTKESYSHTADWARLDRQEFLSTLVGPQDYESVINSHAYLLDCVTDKAGKIYGRAALIMTLDRYSYGYGCVSVGGFVYLAMTDFPVRYIGVLQGTTDDVSRHDARINIPNGILAEWASRQATAIDRTKYSRTELMKACSAVIRLEGEPGNLPYALVGHDFMSFDQVKVHLMGLDAAILMLEYSEYSENFLIKGVDNLNSSYFISDIENNIFVLSGESDDNILTNDQGAQISDAETGSISTDDLSIVYETELFIVTLKSIWGEIECTIGKQRLTPHQMYSKQEPEWVLCFRRK